MGENETVEVKVPAAAVLAVVEKPIVKAAAKKTKKKDKKPVATPDAAPHVTGRLLHMEVGTDVVAFAIKGKKGKAEVFTLKGMDSSAVPATAAMLASLVASKTKLRVEYSTSNENNRLVKMIRAHC